ncbi:thioredoxin family protein [Parapedobacter tibetensis]|uniref:thioredoxin family protein n=1 Tax=Parapedobacter tibetensis TaxID=2972951 RepID=UPI00214DBC47|nr:thioredoxin family protein [Parapedobacter tibetensis]
MLNVFHHIAFILAVSVLTGFHATAQPKAVPIGELTDSMRLHPKPALILLSTSWCTYCRMQKAQLNKNEDFQSASTYLYFSEFDAETKETVIFNDTTYQFKPTGASTGSHELAHALGNLNGRLGFPTWVLINENFEILFKYAGVLKPKELTELLNSVRQHATFKH